MAKKILTKWYTFQREYWTLFNEYLHPQWLSRYRVKIIGD